MTTKHALFMVRDGVLVRQEGPRSWRPIVKDSAESVRRIAAGRRDDVAPYVYDVDGVEAKVSQLQFYQKLEQAHATAWIHSGCRTPEDAMDTFFAGAEAITVELRHMPEEVVSELAGIAEGEIHLGIDVAADMPRPRELVRMVEANGLAGVVLQARPESERRPLESAALELVRLRCPVTVLDLSSKPVAADVAAKVDRWVGFEDPS